MQYDDKLIPRNLWYTD